MASSSLMKIKDLIDLNEYEIKIWSALLAKGVSSAGTLGEISGVPRSRCYDVLESLEKKGFVFMTVGKPLKYIALEPDESLEILKKRTKVEERRQLTLIEEIEESDTITELKSLYNTGINYVNSDNLCQEIIGKSNINSVIKDLLRSKSNIDIHTTEKGTKRNIKLIKQVKPKSKVTIHSPISLKAQNVEFKKKENKLRYIASGSKLLMFTSDENIKSENESAVLIDSDFIVNTFNSLSKK